jgi:hypothetical protein
MYDMCHYLNFGSTDRYPICVRITTEELQPERDSEDEVMVCLLTRYHIMHKHILYMATSDMCVPKCKTQENVMYT